MGVSTHQGSDVRMRETSCLVYSEILRQQHIISLIVYLLFAACALAGCTEPPPEIKSLLLISWDGGQAGVVYDLMADGTLANFNALAEDGLRAEYARSVDPPLTAPAQNAITTGCYPSRTGVVSNRFHNPNDSFYWYRRGLDEPLDQCEPVWVTASRAGLTTAALFFVGGSPEIPGQAADYTIGYGVRDAYSTQETIPLSLVSEKWSGELPASYSPPYEGSFPIRGVARVFLYVLDSSDDQEVNYDTAFLNTSRGIDDQSSGLKVGEWGSRVLRSQPLSGADFLIQEISPSQVRLFHSAVYHNAAAPRELLEALNEKFGFFPAGPDYYALDHGWITPEDNLLRLERIALWMAEVTAWVHKTYQPDLLFTWQDGFDSIGHAFFLHDPRQMDYSPENVRRYDQYFRNGAQIADRALGIMLDPVNLEETAVLMVADHGMAPIHTTVFVNTLLEQAGLLVLDQRNYVVVEQTKAFAVASGGAVNVYINLQGHEKDGIVPPEEYSQVQSQISELFSTLMDPDSGERVFESVLCGDELAALHLLHLNSGDVFAQAKSGYVLDGWRGAEWVFEGTDYYGQHGHNSALPDMQTMFIASGAGIPAGGRVIPPVHITDYAPSIAALLGFPPSPLMDGTVIPALVEGQ